MYRTKTERELAELTVDHNWLDKHIAEQKTQREIMEQVCTPFDPAELCEMIIETDE